MVRTADRPAAALSWFNQHCAAVTAKITKAAQFTVLTQHDKNLRACNTGRDVVTLFDKSAAWRNQLPIAIEDAGLFPTVNGRVRVVPSLQVLFEHQLHRLGSGAAEGGVHHFFRSRGFLEFNMLRLLIEGPGQDPM